MIVLPAIPAIVAALTPIVQAAAVSAAIGGVLGAGVGAVGCGAAGVQEHGAINREVVAQSAHCAVDEGAKGAAIGGAFGVIGPVVAPVIAPVAAPVVQVADDVAGAALQVVDDVAQPVISIVDDAARPVIGAVDDAARPIVQVVDDAARPVLQVVDDAVRPVLNKVRNGAKSVSRGVSSAFNHARNTINARFFNRLPAASATERYVYVVDDAANGLHKIGMTTKQPKIRLDKISTDIKSKVDYVCIIKTDKSSGLEGTLLNMFSNQRTTHPIPHSGMTEWFVLSAAQVTQACSY
ncbi:MAG: GIY-YIG nuclease family protein [Chloroflexi bacterium]|nr:GIY-YIG nuclease family protein [Chloroflexota bacterium]